MQSKFIQFLGIAKRSGNVCEGYNKTEEFIKLKKLSLVIMSKESSENTRKKFKVYCERFKVPIIEDYSKEELGAILGREEINVIGILDKKIGDRLLELNIEESN